MDWAFFLSNDEDNSQYVRLLLQMWSSDSQAIKFVGRSVLLICEGKDFKLTSLDGVHTVREELAEIDSTQEESDSRIILYCQYAKKKFKKKQGYKYVTVKSPDTDVFFILVYYEKRIENISILFETGRGNKSRLLGITAFNKEISAIYTSALLSLYADTGCDTLSAFKDKGKLKPIKALKLYPQLIETLAKLG